MEKKFVSVPVENHEVRVWSKNTIYDIFAKLGEQRILFYLNESGFPCDSIEELRRFAQIFVEQQIWRGRTIPEQSMDMFVCTAMAQIIYSALFRVLDEGKVEITVIK